MRFIKRERKFAGLFKPNKAQFSEVITAFIKEFAKELKIILFFGNEPIKKMLKEFESNNEFSVIYAKSILDQNIKVLLLSNLCWDKPREFAYKIDQLISELIEVRSLSTFLILTELESIDKIMVLGKPKSAREVYVEISKVRNDCAHKVIYAVSDAEFNKFFDNLYSLNAELEKKYSEYNKKRGTSQSKASTA